MVLFFNHRLFSAIRVLLVSIALMSTGDAFGIICNAGYYLSNGTCVKCSAGTYSAAGATSCTSCGTGKYSAAGASSCSTCPASYRDGAAAASKNECVGAFTKTGKQISCSIPENVGLVNVVDCSPGTCTYYKNYAGTITQDCTPADCTRPIYFNCLENYYKAGTTCPTCPACPTSHPYSDEGTTDIANCYTGCGTGYSGRNYYNATDTCSCDTLCTSVANRETRSGSESCTRSCSIANGTCSYSGSTQTYTDTCASNYTDAGCSSAGESCSGCSSWTRTSTGACSGGTISITCNAGYYLSNGTCVKCSAGTYSAAGATSCTSCGTGKYSAAGASSCSTCPSGYRNGAAAASQSACVGAFTKTGSQTACSQPANSTSYACGTCSPGTCTYYKNYAGTITQDCTPANCTQPVASVSCKANYYASGVTCLACPTSYPYSDAGTTSDSYCYASKTSTGSQLSCSQPANSESYACGTCTPGTCNWRDYKSATDTSCTPTDCNQPVNPGSVVCNTGYYTSGTTCPACTNAPSNSSYTGTATSNECPWECDDGYNLTPDNQCTQYCTAGVTHIHLGTGLKIPLYSAKRTTPSINILHNGTICYADLSVVTDGYSCYDTLHVNYNGVEYYTSDVGDCRRATQGGTSSGGGSND